MRLISHRGNLHGPNVKDENKIDYVLNALHKGYDVEIDVWYIKGIIYLGHDEPQYEVPEFKFFTENKDKLWCHCKNIQALDILLPLGIHCFVHNKDVATLTSQNYIWLYPCNEIDTNNSICVLPEWFDFNVKNIERAVGICTDHVEFTRYKFNSLTSTEDADESQQSL